MLLLILFVLLSALCSADIFTAMVDMQNLLGAEEEVNSLIENYIDIELERLDRLKK